MSTDNKQDVRKPRKRKCTTECKTVAEPVLVDSDSNRNGNINTTCDDTATDVNNSSDHDSISNHCKLKRTRIANDPTALESVEKLDTGITENINEVLLAIAVSRDTAIANNTSMVTSLVQKQAILMIKFSQPTLVIDCYRYIVENLHLTSDNINILRFLAGQNIDDGSLDLLEMCAPEHPYIFSVRLTNGVETTVIQLVLKFIDTYSPDTKLVIEPIRFFNQCESTIQALLLNRHHRALVLNIFNEPGIVVASRRKESIRTSNYFNNVLIPLVVSEWTPSTDDDILQKMLHDIIFTINDNNPQLESQLVHMFHHCANYGINLLKVFGDVPRVRAIIYFTTQVCPNNNLRDGRKAFRSRIAGELVYLAECMQKRCAIIDPFFNDLHDMSALVISFL